MAQTITSEIFETLLTDGKPVMVDFSATWCGPCKRIAPFVDTLAEKYAEQAHVVKCDIEECEELALRYGIRNVPTILFIKGGEVVDKQVGAAPLAALEEKLQAIL